MLSACSQASAIFVIMFFSLINVILCSLTSVMTKGNFCWTTSQRPQDKITRWWQLICSRASHGAKKLQVTISYFLWRLKEDLIFKVPRYFTSTHCNVYQMEIIFMIKFLVPEYVTDGLFTVLTTQFLWKPQSYPNRQLTLLNVAHYKN